MSFNTLDQFSAWLYDTQNVSFEEKRDSLETLYTKYTKEGDATEADYRSVTGTRNLGPAGYTPEGGAFLKSQYTPGTEAVVKYKKFTIGLITPEELEEDMYNNGRVKKEKLKFFENMNEDMTDSHNWAREIICADYLVLADSTTVTNTWFGTVRDALALASTAHTNLVGGGTWSNKPTASTLNALALKEAATTLSNIPDDRGKPQMRVKEFTIMCGPYYEWRIPEILKSTLQPDTANNTVNSVNSSVSGVKWNVVINPYIGNTSKRWMLLGSKHALLRLDKQKPTLSKPQVDPHTGNKIRRSIQRFAIYADSARDAVFNLGA